MSARGRIDTRRPVNWRCSVNSGLQAWWLALPGRGFGGTWYDLCGRYNAPITGAPPTAGYRPAPGFLGLQTNGTSQYADAGADLLAAVETTPFTIAALVSQPTAAAGTQFVIGKDWHNGSRGWGLGVSGSGNLYLEVGGSAKFSVSGPYLPGTNDPFLLSASYNGSSTWNCAVNGVSVGTTAVWPPTTNTSPVYLGGRAYSGFFQGFPGFIWAGWVWLRNLPGSDLLVVYDQARRQYPDMLARSPVERWAAAPASPPPPPPPANSFPAAVVGGGFGW